MRPGDGVRRIDDLALASRLSFFLWSSLPDDELLAAAEQRRAARAGRAANAQVKRMLADPRSDALVTQLRLPVAEHRQAGGDRTRIRGIFPYASGAADLREDFREELRLFIDSVLRADRSVRRPA